MIISSFRCKFFGLLTIELNNINYLFSYRKKEFSSIFNLNNFIFNFIANFKKKRGGFFLEIKSEKKVLAMFSITNVFDEFYELGDLAKINKKLPRLSLAKAINLSCNYIIKKNNKTTIYTYPNHFASKLFLASGFEVFSFYRRNVYLYFFNQFFLLPIQVYLKKIHFYKNYFKQKFFLKKLYVTQTRLRFLGLKVFRKLRHNEKRHNFKVGLGLVYEFKKDKHQGDHFFVFNLKKNDDLYFGFEYSDNSL